MYEQASIIKLFKNLAGFSVGMQEYLFMKRRYKAIKYKEFKYLETE